MTAALVLGIGFGASAQIGPPIPELAQTQVFAAYGDVVADAYHTGLDLVEVGGVAYQSPVSAAEDGVVWKVFGLNGGALRRWDPGSGVYFWEAAPQGGSNHGLGMCVIVFHPSLNLYSLYGHLDAVRSGLGPGDFLVAGEFIGRAGNSHQQYLRRCKAATPCPQPADAPADVITSDQTGFGVHLHFEIKDRGVLGGGRNDDEGPWGYTPGPSPATPNMPGHPNWFGYHDPNVFLDHPVVLLGPTPVEVFASFLNVRDYPGTSAAKSLVISSIAGRTDGRLPTFVALRAVADTWFQIAVPTANAEGWSGSGWIAGDYEGATYSRTVPAREWLRVVPESAALREGPASNAPILAYAYGGSLDEPQGYVGFEEEGEWHRVHLPAKAGAPDGWVSASNVELVSAPEAEPGSAAWTALASLLLRARRVPARLGGRSR